MADFRIVKSVKRKAKKSSGPLKALMVILTMVFLVCGIMFSRGFMLPCFLMAVLYLYYDANASREYEYILEDRMLKIDVIRGRRFRTTAHELDLDQMIILAPHDSDEVSAWKNGGTEKIKKYDYTSYENDTPYYTMIIGDNTNKIKLLLDFDEEIMNNLKRKYPNKVHR